MLKAIAQAVYDELLKKRATVVNEAGTSFPALRIESTHDTLFDIMDKRQAIIHGVGEGGATYHNDSACEIRILDYEYFVNSLTEALQKNQRRPDFIACNESGSKLVINELSTGNPKTKKSDALYQMNHVIQLLRKTAIWDNIEAIQEKECVFSCRQGFPSTPIVAGKSLANSFGAIHALVPENLELSFQPIKKAGFKLYQNDHVYF